MYLLTDFSEVTRSVVVEKLRGENEIALKNQESETGECPPTSTLAICQASLSFSLLRTNNNNRM